MVAQNSLSPGRWVLKRFQASVIKEVWPGVLFFSLISLMVFLVSRLSGTNLGFQPTMLSVVTTMLGLVICSRTAEAFQAYQDGRKMWTNITSASRNLAQTLWIHVPHDRSDNPSCKDQTVLEATIEKKTMINLIQAFAVSLKHFLRGEPGVYYEDLYPLISFLPRYANPDIPYEKLPLWHNHDEPRVRPKESSVTLTAISPIRVTGDKSEGKSVQSWPSSNRGRPSRRNSFDPESALPQVESDHPLGPARSPPEASDYLPLARLFKWIGRTIVGIPKAILDPKRRAVRERGDTGSNVPLEIILVLSNYSGYLMRNGLIQPAMAGNVTANLTILQDTLANLERIRNTPMPFALQAHLRMSLWIYLFFLPFQVYSTLGPITIPAVAFASFVFLGFLEIGQEIENPFNYDLNDLGLDHFCLSLQRELHEITAHHNPEPFEFLFSNFNQPFAPADRRGADELLQLGNEYRHPDNHSDPGMQSIRRTLVGSWREVDFVTRS